MSRCLLFTHERQHATFTLQFILFSRTIKVEQTRLHESEKQNTRAAVLF